VQEVLAGSILRTWGAPFEAQGKAVLRPYMTSLGRYVSDGGQTL